MLERATEVNNLIKRPQDLVSRSMVVHFISTYKSLEMDVSLRNQIRNRGSLMKESGGVLEFAEGSGIICRDGFSEDRDVDEIPDFCLPIPEPVTTGH